MKLNGWQRLWILIGTIYLIPILILAISISPPTENDIYQEWVCQLVLYYNVSYGGNFSNITKQQIEQFEQIARKQAPLAPNQVNDAILFNSSCVKFATLDWGQDYFQAITKIRNYYTSKLDNLEYIRIKASCLLLLIFWFIPLVILYMFGWSIGWVYKGFKRNGKKI